MDYLGPRDICIYEYIYYLRYRFEALYVRDLYSNIQLIHLVQCYITNYRTSEV